jgi:hypothetical protein
VLVYNIAALAYQTQNYGQSLLHLKLIIENMDQVEEFIQVKSMFLALQILFELKMPLAAGPLIELLEAKQKEIEKVIEQKSMIKNQHSTQNSASDNSQPGEDTKSWTTNGSVYEALDESVINKNSFCIILGSFIRRSAVSPKTVNMAEFSLMLNSFKAMFDLKNGDSFI